MEIALSILSRVAFLVAVASSAAPAFAAPFNGPFVGAQVGWQSAKTKDVKSSFGVAPVNETKEAVTGGVFAGYDATIRGRFVLGAEAGLDVATDDEAQTTVADTTFTIDPKYSFDLTARAGYLVQPKTLLYVRGGYTNERTRTSIVNASVNESASKSMSGWLVGGGVEHQVAQNVSARLEYRYSKFSENNAKDERHRVLAGLAYRF